MTNVRMRTMRKAPLFGIISWVKFITLVSAIVFYKSKIATRHKERKPKKLLTTFAGKLRQLRYSVPPSGGIVVYAEISRAQLKSPPICHELNWPVAYLTDT